jgi:hypothetical protein
MLPRWPCSTPRQSQTEPLPGIHEPSRFHRQRFAVGIRSPSWSRARTPIRSGPRRNEAGVEGAAPAAPDAKVAFGLVNGDACERRSTCPMVAGATDDVGLGRRRARAVSHGRSDPAAPLAELLVTLELAATPAVQRLESPDLRRLWVWRTPHAAHVVCNGWLTIPNTTSPPQPCSVVVREGKPSSPRPEWRGSRELDQCPATARQIRSALTDVG